MADRPGLSDGCRWIVISRPLSESGIGAPTTTQVRPAVLVLYRRSVRVHEAVGSRIRAARGSLLRLAYGRTPPVRAELTLDEMLALEDLDAIYRYAHYYHGRRSPRVLRDHREYFRKSGRGFGEDAFHALWWLLVAQEQPSRMLEIGVYRGQVISLWSLISKLTGRPIRVHGVSPLADAGDSVSEYVKIDYEADVAQNHSHFGLGNPSITKALSTEPSGADVIRGGAWDVIYIDGGHDKVVVEADYENSLVGLSSRGVIVFDDAALYLPYSPRYPIATAGHPGPSAVVRDRAMKEMDYLGAVGHNVIFRKRGSGQDSGAGSPR